MIRSATDTTNTSSAVSGYMAFILFSVAGLACEFLSLTFHNSSLLITFLSHPVLWVCDLLAYSYVRRRVKRISN